MTDLRTRLLVEIERREQVARDADELSPSPWRLRTLADHHIQDVRGDWIAEATATAEAQHIALADPADALRRYSHYRHILHIHVPTHGARPEEGYDAPTCAGCGRDDIGDPRHLVPCPELRALAEALGIPIEEPATEKPCRPGCSCAGGLGECDREESTDGN